MMSLPAQSPTLRAVPSSAELSALRKELVGFIARRSHEDAEELTQEVLLRITAKPPSDPAKLRGYAFAVAKRLIIDRFRQRARRGVPEVLDEEPAAPAEVHSAAVASQTLSVVYDALRTMKSDVADVFRLRTETTLSFKDIAAQQGVSLNTALGRHHHATKQIARALSAAGLLPERSK